MQTYKIEIRAHFEDGEKYDVLLEQVREAARMIYATAMLLKDKREPQISLETGDMFARNADIALFAENDTTEGNDDD